MEGPICPCNDHVILHFVDEYDIHMSFKNHEESGYWHKLDLLLALILCFISYKKWVQS